VDYIKHRYREGENGEMARKLVPLVPNKQHLIAGRFFCRGWGDIVPKKFEEIEEISMKICV
jgi:hypothetical protein